MGGAGIKIPPKIQSLRLFTRLGISVAKFPPEMEAWTNRCEWLLRDFVCNSRATKESLRDMFRVGNGDSTQPVVTHWCLTSKGPGQGPCCNSDEEALMKFLSHAVHFFGRGYETPLLYRLKHFGPASSFTKTGCCYFNLLPQILKEMDVTTPPSGFENASFVDALLSDNVGDGDLQHLLAEAMDSDKNFAAQNGLRRKMVTEHLNRPEFFKSSMIIDAVIGPMEYGINFLMGHTKILHDLAYFGRCHPKCAELQVQSRSKFMRVISGKLGEDLIKRYVRFLEVGLLEAIEMGLSPTKSQLSTIFNVVLVTMADLERRFRQAFQVPPFTLFKLCDICETNDFVQAFSALEAKFRACPACFDFEFSGGLIPHFSCLEDKSLEDQGAAMQEVQMILEDVATWSPVTSDLVEIKNGQVQWAVSKRGNQNVLGGPSAYETTLLQAAVKQHKWIQDAVALESLPPKKVASGILKMCGTTSTNQYTARAPQLRLRQDQCHVNQRILDTHYKTPDLTRHLRRRPKLKLN